MIRGTACLASLAFLVLAAGNAWFAIPSVALLLFVILTRPAAQGRTSVSAAQKSRAAAVAAQERVYAASWSAETAERYRG